MIPAELQHDLERLAALLLPEHAPLYWIDAADAPERLRDRCCFGYTGAATDLAMQSHLAERGCWIGRRPAVVLNLAEIEHSLDREAYFSPDLMRLAIHGTAVTIAVHELAHAADFADNGLTTLPAEPDLCEAMTEAFAYDIATAGRDAPEYPGWHFGHGAGWLRILVHAVHRADAAGFIFPRNVLWDRPTNTTPLWHTAHANLEPELTQLSDAPLSRINDYAPPAAYADLWKLKTTRWRATRPADDPAADRYVATALSYFKG